MDMNQHCVNLSVHPTRGLVDEKFVVLVQNAPPGFQLTVHALHQCEDGHSWEAFGHYNSSAAGTVNVSEDLSLGGTYSGVEQMGLLWSLRPVPGSKPGLRLRKMNVQTPMEVTISVYQGHQTEGFLDLVPLTAVVVERWYMAPGIRRVPITEEGLTATLFLPPGPGPFPGILDLWGGGGKLVENRAALLASHGLAALTLDYLTPRITLETGKTVGDDYFEKAYRVLEQHPQVLGSCMAILGLSFGAGVALKMSVYSQVMKFRCVVCISGSHVLPVDGSVGEMLSFMSKNAGKSRVNQENQVIFRDLLLPIPTDPKLKVDVGRLQCPLLLILGDDDHNMPAYVSAVDMKEMMQQAGNGHLLTVLLYPNAGHLLEPPYMPYARSGAFRTANTREKGRFRDHSQDLEAVSCETWCQSPCCLCSGRSVGRRDGGTLSRSGRRLEEDAALPEGESVQVHELWSSSSFPPVTETTANDGSVTWKSSSARGGSTHWIHQLIK